MSSISEKLSFFTIPIYKTVFQTEDRFDFIKQSWINLSEFLCSLPGQSGFIHNYHVFQERSPLIDPQQEFFSRQACEQIETIKQIAAWIFIAVISWFNPTLGVILIAATVGPKLVHRLADVPAHQLTKSPLLYQGDTTSCTYPGGEVGVNIDDWAYSSMNGFTMIFDGVGHGSPKVVEQEYPLYLEMAESYEAFVKEFDYNQKDASKIFQKAADKIVNTLDEKMRVYRETCTEIRKSNLSIHQNLIQKKTLSEEEIHQLIETLDRKNIRKNYEILLDQYGTFESVHLCFEHLADLCDSASPTKNVALFQKSYEDLLSADDKKSSAKGLFWGLLPHKIDQISISGPAFGVAHVFQDSREQSYLYTSHSADIGFLIIHPQTGSKTVDVSSIQDSQCEWIEETKDGSGLGASDKYTGVSRLVSIPSGSLVYSFTDGIGGFLSRKEILDVIKTAPPNMLQLVNQLDAKIRDPSHHIGEDKVRADTNRQSACNLKIPCKRFDPTGKIRGCVDDIAITCLRVR